MGFSLGILASSKCLEFSPVVQFQFQADDQHEALPILFIVQPHSAVAQPKMVMIWRIDHQSHLLGRNVRDLAIATGRLGLEVLPNASPLQENTVSSKECFLRGRSKPKF